MSSYLCMDEKGKDIPLWTRGSWKICQQTSNANLDQVGGIGLANKVKPLKLDYNSGKFFYPSHNMISTLYFCMN